MNVGNKSEYQYKFDAFVSYSTDPDYILVRDIERFLESFHKLSTPEKIKLKKLEICRDGSDFQLSRKRESIPLVPASNPINNLIEEQLAKSRYLLIFCSRNASKSIWVDQE